MSQSAATPTVHANVQQHSSSSESSSESEDDQHDVPEVVVLDPQPANAHKMTTRGKAGVMKPNPHYALFTVKGLPQPPRTIVEALNHPGWNGSMGEEIETCHETET